MRKIIITSLALGMSIMPVSSSQASVNKANKTACVQAQTLIKQMYLQNMASMDKPTVHDAKWEKSVKDKANKLRSYAKPATGKIKSTINDMAATFDRAIKLKNNESDSFGNSLQLLAQSDILDQLCSQ